MEEKFRQFPNIGSSKVIKIALFGPDQTKLESKMLSKANKFFFL